MFHINIKEVAVKNTNYRQVLHTTPQQQLVVMSLKPKEDIDFEIHPKNDQFIRIERGRGIAYVGKNKEYRYDLSDDSVIMIPAGTWHQIVNTSTIHDLKLYTIYSPPHHPEDKIDINKPPTNLKETLHKNKYFKYKTKYLKLKDECINNIIV